MLPLKCPPPQIPRLGAATVIKLTLIVISSKLFCHSKTTEENPLSKAELGDKIFERILQWYPDEKTTAKLTGMLLEMNINEIQKLMQEDELLKCKADEAYRVLEIPK